MKILASLAVLVVLATVLPIERSHAAANSVRIVVARAGLIIGGGGGRGVLTFRHREYPFKVWGLSAGPTIGASVVRLWGRVSYLHELDDFAGTYSAVGGGIAFGGGVGVVQLRNPKGVMITLRGAMVGLEFSAFRSSITIALDGVRESGW